MEKTLEEKIEREYYKDGETTADGRAWKKNKTVGFREAQVIFHKYMPEVSRVWIYKAAERYDFGYQDEKRRWHFLEKRMIKYLEGKLKPRKAGRPLKRGPLKQAKRTYYRTAKTGDRVIYRVEDNSGFFKWKATVFKIDGGYIVSFDKKICSVYEHKFETGTPGHCKFYTGKELRKHFKIIRRYNPAWEQKSKRDEKKSVRETIREQVMEKLKKEKEGYSPDTH